MQFFGEILSFINVFFLKGMFISVMTIFLFKKYVGMEDISANALKIIKWIIVPYAVITLAFYLILMFYPVEKYSVVNRATGPYWWNYWLMFTGHVIIPLLLLNKKLGSNIYFILFVCFIMNIGSLLEMFVLRIISLHRDYLPKDWYRYSILPSFGQSLFIIKSVIIGLLALAGGYLMSLNTKKYTKTI